MQQIPTRFQVSSDPFLDFWKSEGGFSLLSQLPKIPNINSAKQFSNLLLETDEIADAVINKHFLDPKNFSSDLENVIQLIISSNSNHGSSEILALKNQINHTPTWLDRNLLKLGCQVCNISGKSGLIILRNFSLMTGYMSAAINKPLVATGALKKGATKRIGETTEFWVAVTQLDNLQVSKSGFYYAIKTRLIHAYSRKMILKHTNWNVSEQGLPLNHWDMLATYLGFSVVFLEGLEKVGFKFSENEKMAVYHLWRYIGYLIGIPDTILPQNHQQAITALYLWSKTQPKADTDTILLANALHMEPMLAKFPKYKLQKQFIQNINLAFNYFLIGQKSCEILQLPKVNFIYKTFVNFVVYINKLDTKLSIIFPFYKKMLVSKGLNEQIIIKNSYLNK